MGHIGPSEPQILRGKDLAAACQHRRGEIERCRQFPACDHKVKIRRSLCEQLFQQRERRFIIELLEFVEDQHTRLAVPLDRHTEQPRAALERARAILSNVGNGKDLEYVQPRLFEGESEIGIENLR